MKTEDLYAGPAEELMIEAVKVGLQSRLDELQKQLSGGQLTTHQIKKLALLIAAFDYTE